MSRSAIQRYFTAFNEGDIDGMLAELDEDVAHHVNEGQVRRGKILFRAFCDHMARCYRENLSDMVIFANEDETRGAAEFVVNGKYLQTDGDLPEATGQSYVLPAGSFFNMRDGKIVRVTTYYNLADWVRQVS
ncbi:MAG: nuclear transport factor 2 family protein [Rhodobacteraceae bacterium]|nr:nuclear transport factor 2 family protein [Paracoccaceae bacterium]